VKDEFHEFNMNVNDGSHRGVGWLPGSIGGGIRNSSANYLALAVGRTNLKILTSAQVTKVLFENIEGEPKAVGVEYGAKAGGPSHCRSAVESVLM
jgi:choline dehydrogenase